METAERSGLTLSVIMATVLLAACAGPASAPSPIADNPAAEPVIASVIDPEPPLPPAEPLIVADAKPIPQCSTEATQGGAIVCRAPPGAVLSLDGNPVALTDKDGWAVIGLSRTQKTPAIVSLDLDTEDGIFPLAVTVPVLMRTDTVAKLTMECNKISAQSPAEKRHAEASWVKKDKALKTFANAAAPMGMIKPAEGPYSSPFGAVRTYMPKTKDCEGSTSVHNGQDIAVATGTEIHAPMAGTVLLADPDLYYEGGAVFLDHGYGLVSVMMHMSRIDVADGQVVQQGDVLGLSGSTGRVTGPHLHWAIKFRNVTSDDGGTDIWLDPVLMMGLALPQ
ncbi:MAG: hypothetical protein B7Y90_03440 [Alphaproteobacteria bacterium 32-64-14]|nr:MAG: hypothetical protein B7Y90_03440 [Alphaproteobacteria bacterium 32-64-14]